jgi:hypothetical protein
VTRIIDIPGLIIEHWYALVAASCIFYALWVQTCRRCIGRMFRRG